MSATNIFKSNQTMPRPEEGVVRVEQAAERNRSQLPGATYNDIDVQNTHAGRPNPTGRRP